MFIRIHQEAQGTVDPSVKQPEDPVATLLDITKACPTVNRPILWSILTKFGIKGKMRRALEGLHEQTEYKFRGKETNSASWTPKRGLREGCATSPKLFNVYHSTLMRLAKEKRRKKCEKDGTNLGIEEWQYIPGHSLLASERQKKSERQHLHEESDNHRVALR